MSQTLSQFSCTSFLTVLVAISLWDRLCSEGHTSGRAISHGDRVSYSAAAELYEEAAKQFRDDVAVNPSDTEEAIWAFLSEAKLMGSAKARQQFLQVAPALSCSNDGKACQHRLTFAGIALDRPS